MKTNELLIAAAVVAAVGVGFYIVAKKSNVIPGAPGSPTATNPAGTSNPTGTGTGNIGQYVSAGESLWGFLTGASNNSGSTNSTSGTNSTNNSATGTGWYSTGIDNYYGSYA